MKLLQAFGLRWIDEEKTNAGYGKAPKPHVSQWWRSDMPVKSIGKDRPRQPDGPGELRHLPLMVGLGVNPLQSPVHEGIGQGRQKNWLRPLELTTSQQLYEDDLGEPQRHEVDGETSVD